MPYPRSKTFKRWRECDRCGFDFPLNELSRDYSGARVCQFCYDPKGFEENLQDISMPFEDLEEEEYVEDIL
jgi:hypothetical protein